MTMKKLLTKKDNDYSKFEKKFRDATGKPLVSEKPKNLSSLGLKTVSIIIPAYNSGSSLKKMLFTLGQQTFYKKHQDKVQIILIDDHSNKNLKDIALSSGLPLAYIRHKKNLGWGTARNTGLKLADNDLVFFIDSDMILPPHYMEETVHTHEIIDDKRLLLLNFKENLEADDTRVSWDNLFAGKIFPNWRKDWRNERFCSKDFAPILLGYPPYEERIVHLLQETRMFKDFGNLKYIGVWALPCVVVSHGISLHTSLAKQFGFCEKRDGCGWGGDDTLFGACAIASGCYVVPHISCCAYHINHGNYTPAAIKKKRESLRRSAVLIEKLLNKDITKFKSRSPTEICEEVEYLNF